MIIVGEFKIIANEVNGRTILCTPLNKKNKDESFETEFLNVRLCGKAHDLKVKTGDSLEVKNSFLSFDRFTTTKGVTKTRLVLVITEAYQSANKKTKE